MADVVQTKVVEVLLQQDNSVTITLDTRDQVQPRPGLEKWRVGSHVYGRQDIGYTCLDEIEEDKTLQGNINELGDYFCFVSKERTAFIIPKRQVIVSADPTIDAFLIRKNNKLYILNQASVEYLQMKTITPMLDKCAFCQRIEDSKTQLESIGECNHKMHQDCLVDYVKKRKMMCCPHFWCRRPFREDIVKWVIDQL